VRGLFPEGEPGDRWRWAAIGVIGFVVVGVLRSHAVRPVTYLAFAVVGAVLLVLVIIGLVNALR
jgi:hypothetical protein